MIPSHSSPLLIFSPLLPIPRVKVQERSDALALDRSNVGAFPLKVKGRGPSLNQSLFYLERLILENALYIQIQTQV